jgi:MarR family transcriptional regulator, organic hydroperoxide resistance regulator
MAQSLSYLFNQVSNFYRINFEKHMSAIGLHAGQVFVLEALWETDGQTQADLVRILQVSAPTINVMVRRLAENGFVEMRKDYTDARFMRVFLTEKGTQIRLQAVEQMAKFEGEIFSPLSEPEKLMLFMLLEKIKKL